MKMNRTEWLVVLICAGALAWLMTRPSPPKPEEKKADVTEVRPGDPSKPGEPAKPGEAVTPPTAPLPPPVEAKTVVITNEAAKYTFTNIGGAMQQVEILSGQYAGKTPQGLNDQRTQGPIGGLSTAPGEIEKLVYTEVAKTDHSITYVAENKGLKITKEWSLFPVPEGTKSTDGFGYVWDLKVTIQNTGADVQSGSYYLYSGLLGKLHANDWIEPAATWYADSDAIELNQSEFDRSTFLGLWEQHPARDTIKNDLKEMSFAGVHNQYYCIIIRPIDVKKDGKTAVWAQRRFIEREDPGRTEVKAQGLEAAVGMDSFTLSKDQSYTWKGQVYTGPRSGSVLNTLDKQFDTEFRQVMHYGWFRVLSRLFLGTLNTFFSWIGSYGLSVMMLTLLVRVCIWIQTSLISSLVRQPHSTRCGG